MVLDRNMEYQLYPIERLCSLVKGSYSATKTKPGKYPLVVTGSARQSADTYQIDSKAVCIPLVSSTGHGNASIKRIHYQEGKFALANILIALLPDPAICDAKYLFYLLSYRKEMYFVPLMRGSANVSLNPLEISRVRIPLPPLSEQKKIAGIFCKANDVRLKVQDVNEAMNQLTHTVFVKIFGDPAINPFEWHTYNLGELAEIRAGIPLSKARRPLNSPAPYLTVRNVYAGHLNLSDVRHIEVNDNELSKWALKAGDLLILEGNGARRNVGRTAIFNGELSNCVHQNHIFRARLKDSVILPIFAMTYLNSPQVKSKFFQFARTTSGINNINLTQLKSLSVYCPPIDLQEKFVKVAKVIQELGLKQEYLLNKVIGIVDSLANKFFRSSTQIGPSTI
jgi:type I restriction enzyme, S subunit